MTVAALLGNLVSNVPAVMLPSPAATHPQAGSILALAGAPAGDLLLVGGIANLIVADAAARYPPRLARSCPRAGVSVTLARGMGGVAARRQPSGSRWVPTRNWWGGEPGHPDEPRSVRRQAGEGNAGAVRRPVPHRSTRYELDGLPGAVMAEFQGLASKTAIPDSIRRSGD